MANEIRLELYTFKIRAKKNKDQYEVVSDFFKSNFTKFIQSFVNEYDKKNFIDEKLKRSFKIAKSPAVSIDIANRMISGVIASGDYGTQSQIEKQDGTVKATKNKNDLDVRPFYFLIKVPKTGKRGLIMLQRTGIYGISNIFQETFVSFFETNFADYRIETAQYLSKELAQDFVKNGFIKEISLSRFSSSTDKNDMISKSPLKEDIDKIEVRLFSKRGRSFPFDMSDKAAKFINNKNTAFFDITPYASLGYTKDNTTITIKVKDGKKTHSIDLSDTGQIKPYYNIDETVKKDEATQLPVFSSIDKIAKEYLADINFDV